jgi:uncharacterized protein YndB with AHSA1/START domain
MITIEKSVVIDRNAEDVFCYVGDQTNAPLWQRGLVDVRRTTADPIAVGTKHSVVRTLMGRTLELSNGYTRDEPDRLVEFTSEDRCLGRRRTSSNRQAPAGRG